MLGSRRPTLGEIAERVTALEQDRTNLMTRILARLQLVQDSQGRVEGSAGRTEGSQGRIEALIERTMTKMADQVQELMDIAQAMSDSVDAANAAIADFRADFDAAIALLQGEAVPPNLQPAIDKFMAARTGLDTASAAVAEADKVAEGITGQPTPPLPPAPEPPVEPIPGGGEVPPPAERR